MSDRVEFSESTGDGRPDGDEVLEAGGGWNPPAWLRRVPPVAWTAVAALVLAGAVAVGLGRGAGTDRAAQRPSTPASSAAARTLAPLTPEQRALGLVRTQARDPEPLGDVVRAEGSTCRLVAIGSPTPQDRAERALRRVLPEYTVIDVGRILDNNSGLCSLSVRARDAAGSTLVLTVNGPDGAGQAQTVYTREDDPRADTATIATIHTTRDGWAVRIGTDGPAADEPRPFDLVQIAEDATLRW